MDRSGSGTATDAKTPAEDKSGPRWNCISGSHDDAPQAVVARMLAAVRRDIAEGSPESIQQIAAMLAAYLLERDAAVKTLSDDLQIEYQLLYRLLRKWGVYQPRRTHTAIPATKSKQILRLLIDTDLSRRQIAAKLGVSKGSVDRRAERLKRRIMDSVGGTKFVPSVWKCPVHGLVAYHPCVACEAQRRP